MMRLLLLSVVALVVLSAGYTRAQETTTTAPPPPPPYRNQWTVSDGTLGAPCIKFDANVTVAIKYEKLNSTSRSDFVNVVVPATAEVDHDRSSCIKSHDYDFNVTAQRLFVTFTPENNSTLITPPAWTIAFYFTDDSKQASGKAFGLYKIELDAVYAGYPQFIDAVRYNETFVSKTSFSGVVGATANHSAQCSTGDLSLNENAKVHLDTFRVQAYGNSDDFLTSELCDHDVRTSDIVPIVVGACLAALVIIVLIAYLIGRARAKRQGYASV